MDESIIFTKALAFLKFISEEKMDEPLKVAQKKINAPQNSSPGPSLYVPGLHAEQILPPAQPSVHHALYLTSKGWDVIQQDM